MLIIKYILGYLVTKIQIIYDEKSIWVYVPLLLFIVIGNIQNSM